MAEEIQVQTTDTFGNTPKGNKSKKVWITAISIVVGIIVFVIVSSLFQPKSQYAEIKASYTAAGYDLNDSRFDGLIISFKNQVGDSADVFVAVKGANGVMVFKCPTTQDAKDMYNAYKGQYPTAYNGVDLAIVIAGDSTHLEPFNSVVKK